MKSRPSAAKSIHPRFRIICGKDIAVGPGKVELLKNIQSTGSISSAAARMDMSYMRAWTLIKTMERCFKNRLVRVIRGGEKGGGAELTEAGEKILALYSRMETESLRAIAPAWKEIQKMLKSGAG